MKTKTVFAVSASVAAFLVCGCSDEPWSGEATLPVGIEAANEVNSDIVTLDEISQILTGACNLPVSRSLSEPFFTESLRADLNPTIYVINYENGGWMLLSAAKTYQPVLAYSETGRFDICNIWQVAGVENWIDATMADIETSLQLPEDSVKETRMMWEMMLSTGMTPPFADSRATIEENIAMARQTVNDSINSWTAKGFRIRPIAELDFFETEEENQLAIENLKNNTYWAIMDDFERYTYIVEGAERLPGSKSKKLECTTLWHQNSPYNRYFPHNNVAGCTTIAVAQIMNYYKWPATYNWSDISSAFYTSTLGEMLYDVACKIGVNYTSEGTNADTEDVCTMLKKSGFDASKRDLEAQTVMSSIDNGNPVFAAGNYTSHKGHAWVISGYNQASGTIHLKCVYYMPQPSSMTKTLGTDIVTPPSPLTFYCHWGWGGMYDGYYTSGNFCPDGNNYNIDNKIIIITPNK